MIRSDNPIEEFIGSIESKPFKTNTNSSLKLFFHFYKKDIFELTINDLIDFQEELNELRVSPLTNQTLCLRSKQTRFGHIKKFVKFLLKHYKDRFDQNDRIEFKLDLNDRNFFEWKEDHPEPNTAYKRLVMTKEELKGILTYLNNERPIKYLMFRTLAESGMRKGESYSIDIFRNIEGKIISIEEDLNNRFLRVKGKKGLLKYFISQELADQLKTYLHDVRPLRVKKYNATTKAFFISQKGKRFTHSNLNHCLNGNGRQGEYIYGRTKGVLRTIKIDKHITPQTFRRTLNTHRKDIGVSTEDREVLINHKSSKVNINYYTITNDQQFRDLFDKSNPYKKLFKDLNY